MARFTISNLMLIKMGRCFVRKFSACTQAEEIRIPTCYGHIAGKIWGPETGRKVLALHGWQDNCGTFDTLIPLLPKHLRIVAVDFPGHGLSSHKPMGCLYSFVDLLVDVKSIVSNLKWDNFTLMGHSMGGAVSMIYASCFPEEIEAVVTLDGVDSDNAGSFKNAAQTASLIHKIAALNAKLHNQAPMYSREAAFNRLLAGQKNFMTGVGIFHLLKRAIKAVESDPNLFVFTRDLRLQAFNFQPTSPDIWIAYLQSLQCDVLRVKAKDGVRARSTLIGDFLVEHFKEKKETLQLVEVEGLHHVHLEEPERVAPYLTAFFAEEKVETVNS